MAVLSCDVTLGNTGRVCRKYVGVNNGLIFSKTRTEIATVSAASTQSTYTALIRAALATRIYPLWFDNVEVVDNEVVMVENADSSTDILFAKGGKEKFKLRNPSDWDAFNMLLGSGTRNAELYVYRMYSLNAIRGIYDSTRVKFQMEKVAVKKSFTRATNAEGAFMILEIESLEPTSAEDSVCTIEPSFALVDLEGLTDLVLTDDGSVVGVVKVNVRDKATGVNDMTDLVTTDFIVKIAGVITAHTSFALVGDAYNLTAAAFVAGDVTVELATPTVMAKNYEMYGNPITITLLTPLNYYYYFGIVLI